MSFDFHELYKSYSNVELLKIVRRPAGFQPDAVAVATRILSERPVTAEEIRLVDQHFDDLDRSAAARKEKSDALKGKATSFLEPVLHPSEKVQPAKWINILLAALSIQYSWWLFGTVRNLITLLRCDYCRFDIVFFIELLTLLYIPLTLFLVFKKRSLGWILLFVNKLFSLLSTVSQSYIFFKYRSIHHGSAYEFFLSILLNAAFVFFLWREPIASYFGITPLQKKLTAIITAGATAIYILAVYLIARSITT